MQTRIVRAQEPTLLSGQEYYDLASSDLLFISVPIAYVVEGSIDFERFCEAVKKTLQVYPLFAGRLDVPRERKGTWRIHLSNEGIPVPIQDSDAQRVTPVDSVIQSPLALCDQVASEKLRFAFREEAAQEPLTRILVTRFTSIGQTSIGFQFSHLIGDGEKLVEFSRLLSQNYQCLPPLDPAPSYIARLPSDSPAPGKHIIARIDELEENFPREALGGPYDPRLKVPTAPITFQLRPAHIAAVRAALVQADPAGCAAISRQDAIIALLVECVTLADKDAPPITTIGNFSTFRGIADYNAPCNAYGFSISGVEHAATRQPMSKIAKQTREALTRWRDVDFITDYWHVQCDKMRRATMNDEMISLTPGPGRLTVNSTWKLDFTTAHFGFPESCRFYHETPTAARYVKIVAPNPTRNHDGSWTSYPGWAEITIFLQPQLKEAFLKVLTDTLKSCGEMRDVIAVELGGSSSQFPDTSGSRGVPARLAARL